MKSNSVTGTVFTNDDAKFSHINTGSFGNQSQIMQPTTEDWQYRLRNTASKESAQLVILEAIIWKLSRILTEPIESIVETKSLIQYGADSLVLVELRNWILAELKAKISMSEAIKQIPLSQLAAKILGSSALVTSSSTTITNRAQVKSLHTQSDLVDIQTHSERDTDDSFNYMKKQLDLHSTNIRSWPKPTEGHHLREYLVVLLTGATGFIGTSILDLLIKSSKVTKVYALIRPNSEIKIKSSFKDQGLDWDQACATGKLDTLEYSMGDKRLELDVGT